MAAPTAAEAPPPGTGFFEDKMSQKFCTVCEAKVGFVSVEVDMIRMAVAEISFSLVVLVARINNG